MTIHVDPKLQRQAELEIEMSGLGAAAYRSRVRKDIEAERGYETKSGRHIVEAVVQPLGDAIKAFVEEVYSGRPGPKAVAAKLIKDMDPYVVAFLASRSILGRMMKAGSPTLLTLANTVARQIELEARFTTFANTNKALFAVISKSLAEGGANERHKATVLTYAMGKHNIPWDRWSRTDMLHLGIKMIELFCAHTGLASIEPAHTGGDKSAPRDQYLVHLTTRSCAWIDQSILGGELLSPQYMPTIIPPKDWEGLQGGGYHTDTMHPLPLVRRLRSGQRKLLEQADLTKVLAGLNAIQKTPWQINGRVLDVMAELAKGGAGVADMVPREDVPMPEKPVDIDTNPEAKKVWKWAARDVHVANLQRRQDRLSQQALLDLAGKFREEPTIYFPHNLDFRGRAYPVPLGLHPQGSDKVKALLHFAEAKPLGDDGERWLAIHGANCFGVDKVSFDERVSWVHEHAPQIVQAAQDPLGYQWWTEADSPWCFLAFCFEWLGMLNSNIAGVPFLSRIPIALDGSCNGLQHFSAMLRDSVGGRAVNLMPAEQPQDIYQAVADRVMAQLRLILSAEGDVAEKGRWAHEWLQIGVDRKVTKRPVMVLPYGGTARSCLKYVDEAIRGKIAAGQAHNFGDELPQAISFLSSVVWHSIGDVVIAARDAMDWLQKSARVLAKQNLPMHWTTPSGFVGYQAYLDMKMHRIKAKIAGSVVRPAIYEETSTIDNSKQATSVSPNFVHSYDAAAMILTVEALSREGINSFAMIHDSYGTHACHATALSRSIREVFVGMYERNPLELMRDTLISIGGPDTASDLPDLPATGDLDLRLILQSNFFFA